ncbi:MAG: 2Fe-2S iron-sulfur cluster-binding protein [Deltaproteobacteria bacterium]|nr:2Fe-2S iron-sulfur cluster-binding protein [Deltaproteobacteria bacterium]
MRSLSAPALLATVDGEVVRVASPATVLQACEAAGAGVVALCAHDSVSSAGTCGSCQVIANGMVVRACREPLRADAVINTRGKAAVVARRQALAQVAAKHPSACSVCHQSGACGLQDALARSAPVPSPAITLNALPAGTHSDALGDEVVLHKELCVGCTRCTSFANHVLKVPLLSLQAEPGHAPVLVVNEEEKLNAPYALAFTELCPTGVFTAKRVPQTQRWTTQATPSVCPRCATGCPVWLHHDHGQLRRVSSRGGAHFLCDEGYRLPLPPPWPRLSVPVAGGAVVSWDRALDAASALLAPAMKAGTLGVVLSAQASTFDLCAISAFAIERALATRTYVWAHNDGQPLPPLVSGDKSANRAAVAVLANRAVALEQLPIDLNAGTVTAVLVVGPIELAPPGFAALVQALQNAPVLVVASVYEDPLVPIAKVAFPLAPFTETQGSFVNGAGHPQALRPVSAPQGDALPGWELINHLARRLGVELGFDNLTDVRGHLLRRHPSLIEESQT